MKNFRSSLVIVLLVTFSLMSMAGCTKQPAGQGKTITIATQYSIATLNPFMTSADGDGYIIRQVMEPLVSGETGDLRPLLAESWTNPTPLTWEFKLRENAYWHEGNSVYPEGADVQVKAEDVKACWEYVLDPANKAQYQARLASVIERVEVVDDFTVRFTTYEPAAWFLTDIHRLPIFSMKALEELGQDTFDYYPIGTGPFKFVEYVPDDKVVLERNDQYFIKPNLDKIVFQIIPDQNVAAIALRNKEVDVVLQIPSTTVEAIQADNDLTVERSSERGVYRYIAFNCASKFFSDKRVRDAVAMAIDLDAAAEAIFGSPLFGERAYCSVVPGIPGYSDCSDLWSFDPEAAKSLLAEAGWTPGGDGILAKDGVKFSFSLIGPTDAARSKLGIIVATDLKNIGIDCKPQSVEWATLIDDMNSGNYHMGISGGYGGEDGLFQLFHSTEGGGPELNYANEDVDALLSTAKVTVDLEEREAILIEAARLIAADRAHIPAYLEYWQSGLKKAVQDFKPISAYLPLTSPYRNVDIVTK